MPDPSPRSTSTGPSRDDGSTVPATRPDSAAPELGALAVLAMLASLVGIAGVGYAIYAFKFLGHHLIFLLPSRVFFVGSLGLAVAPFLLILFVRRIPYLLLVIPLALLFLLYPLLNPHGIVYGQDAIFNFQFASSFLLHPLWVGGANTSGQAVTYSYYPASGLFNAEGSVFLGLPISKTFLWTLPTLRLLVLPPLIFAIAQRLFGSRAAVLGVLLYLAAPSITLNDIVQQEFAIVFFGLTLGAVTFLLYVPVSEATPLRILVLIFSSFVILSHHLTSYVLGVWLAGLAVLPLMLWGRPAFTVLRAGVVALRYFAIFSLFTLFFTAAVLLEQLTLLEKNILLLLGNASLSARAAARGESYPLYQLAWIILALGLLTLLVVLTLRVVLRERPRPYLATSLLLSVLVLVVAFVLFPTSFAFVAIRTTEYSLFIAAPAAAWFLLRGVIPALERRTRGRRSWSPRARRRAVSWAAPAFTAVVVLFVFTGGNLVPGLSRDQFQPPHLLTVNSPLHLTPATYQDGVWARAHLSDSVHVWGDLLVFDVYSGFGGIPMAYNSYDVFSNQTPNGLSAPFPGNFTRLHVGDYIVTDVYDTQIAPTFYGVGTDQPSGPLTHAQLSRFNDTAYFAVLFVDPVFTVYLVTAVP